MPLIGKMIEVLILAANVVISNMNQNGPSDTVSKGAHFISNWLNEYLPVCFCVQKSQHKAGWRLALLVAATLKHY